MDRLALVDGEYLVVSIQRLGRADGYRPMAAGRIVRGRVSFESDAPPRIDSWEGLDINGLENPVTALEVDGVSLTLGFAGNWQGDASSAGRASVEVDPLRGQRAVLFEPPSVCGNPRVIGGSGLPRYQVVLKIETMRLVREVDGSSQESGRRRGFRSAGSLQRPTPVFILLIVPMGHRRRSSSSIRAVN